MTAFECIRLRVPALWPDYWDANSRMWCCCEDLEDAEADTGTLWIDYSIFLHSEGGADADPAATLAFAQRLSARVAEAESREEPAGAILYAEATADGSIRRKRYTGEDKDGPLLFHRWDRVRAIGALIMTVHFSLVYTGATADRPAWRRLAETLEREIRAAEIGLPGSFRAPRAGPPEIPSVPAVET